ncbi:hypothetical protein T017_000495 [Salmonella enterica subsp. enterica serovar Pomona]|nr:hypothetical protein [Salmonella enterica subsp. enterica serovar Thompson]EDR7289090.1 hypothetical protein [Salmonella enterica subsp. enterica serovar Pomona]
MKTFKGLPLKPEAAFRQIATLISAIITLIEGVEELIKEADTKLNSLIK